jgi:catechol 2,3-dioxygenase-like lactoylglutathione lyase family enzyme
MSTFPGIAHIAVTVTDLSVSKPWYRRLLAVDPVLDEDTGPFYHVAFPLPGGTLLALHQFTPDTARPGAADEHNIGLDHVSFGVANRNELEEWAKRLDELGIEHGKIVDAHYGSGLAFRDPDNIPLEFFAPPS